MKNDELPRGRGEYLKVFRFALFMQFLCIELHELHRYMRTVHVSKKFFEQYNMHRCTHVFAVTSGPSF